jgi:hypothetical protein
MEAASLWAASLLFRYSTTASVDTTIWLAVRYVENKIELRLLDQIRDSALPWMEFKLRLWTASEAAKESLSVSHYFVIVPITLPGKVAIAAVYGSTDGSSKDGAESRCRTI